MPEVTGYTEAGGYNTWGDREYWEIGQDREHQRECVAFLQ
jgi:hypothetical protein